MDRSSSFVQNFIDDCERERRLWLKTNALKLVFFNFFLVHMILKNLNKFSFILYDNETLKRFGYVNEIKLIPTYDWLAICLTILLNTMYLMSILWPNYWNMKYLLLNVGWNMYMALGLLYNICKAFLELYKLEAKFETLFYIFVMGMFLTINYFNLIKYALCWYKFYNIDSRVQKFKNKLILNKCIYNH